MCFRFRFRFLPRSLLFVGWTVQSTLMNAREMAGVPQNRNRLYIVGILNVECTAQSGPEFKWPEQIPMVDIKACLGHASSEEAPAAWQHLGPGRKLVVQQSCAAAREAGHDPDKDSILVDHNSAKVNWRLGFSPCLTASRAKHGGHWMTWKKRKMTVEEMMRLQGVNPRRFPGWQNHFHAGTMGHIVGNAICIPVLVRIMSTDQGPPTNKTRKKINVSFVKYS